VVSRGYRINEQPETAFPPAAEVEADLKPEEVVLIETPAVTAEESPTEAPNLRPVSAAARGLLSPPASPQRRLRTPRIQSMRDEDQIPPPDSDAEESVEQDPKSPGVGLRTPPLAPGMTPAEVMERFVHCAPGAMRILMQNDGDVMSVRRNIAKLSEAREMAELDEWLAKHPDKRDEVMERLRDLT
jgi:hypothetical protein